jgi:cell division protein FtsB
MKKIKLKVGDVLLAKDECVMTSDFKPSLTIGKYYTVKSSVGGQFMVIDDQKCQHFFDTSNLDEYFYIPNKLVAPSANAKPIVLDELGQTEARVLDAPKWGELVEAPKEKKSSTNSKVIKTLKAENEALTQSNLKLIEELNSVHKENAEFKKRHKSLLKANQESMERRVQLGEANMKLLSENEELKARCEALTLEVSQLEKDLGVANATVYLQKETRDDLIKQIKGLKEIIANLEAGEGNQSIWSKIKNLCN